MKLNQKGGATTIILTMIPLLLALLCGFLVIRSWLLISFDLKQTCREQTLELQQQNISKLEALFHLNPIAQNLRLDLIKGRAMVAAGFASKNPMLVTLGNQKIQRVMLQKRSLDMRQKGIIASANLHTKIASTLLLQNLKSTLSLYKNRFSFFVDLDFASPRQKVPTLAVRPDIAGELAPVYETESNFSRKQMASTSWSLGITSQGRWTANWLNIDSQQTFSCQTSIRRDPTSWKLSLKKP